MYKKILLWALLPWSSVGFAQQTIYYDKFYAAISNMPTEYSRTLENDGDAVIFADVRRDTVIMKGRVEVGEYPHLANALIEYLKGDCNPYKFKEEFKRMRCEFDVYKDNGKLRRSMVSHDAKLFYGQLWDDAGTPVLTRGNGKEVSESARNVAYSFYVDSVLVEDYCVRKVERDTVYNIYDVMAVPKGGYQSFVQELTKYIKYPGDAQNNRREARIYIEFFVDKNGNLTEFRPLTNTGYSFEEKTVKRMEKLRPWEPATFRGKPVKTKFVLPISFRLN
jgi:TonB family protein